MKGVTVRIELHVFMALAFAAMVGGVVMALTRMSGDGLTSSVIAGGGAFGVAYLWAGSVIKPPKDG